MQTNPDPNQETFCADDFSGTPLLEGMKTLASETGQTLADFETMRIGAIVDLAKSHYGDALPEIWRIWIDWNSNDGPQPMGDL